ncbi:MAG: hypothetical protein ACOC2F_01280, partial [Bacteroidota bacterium]
DEKGADPLPESLKKNPESMSETIENNVRRLIIDEMPVNPKYYEEMSRLLDELIEQRKREATDYQKYLEKVIALAKKVRKPESGSDYPKGITTPALRALFDNLEEIENNQAAEPEESYGNDDAKAIRAQKAIELNKAIQDAREASWRGNIFKERKIRKAIKSVVGDNNELADNLLEIARNQHEY